MKVKSSEHIILEKTLELNKKYILNQVALGIRNTIEMGQLREQAFNLTKSLMLEIQREIADELNNSMIFNMSTRLMNENDFFSRLETDTQSTVSSTIMTTNTDEITRSTSNIFSKRTTYLKRNSSTKSVEPTKISSLDSQKLIKWSLENKKYLIIINVDEIMMIVIFLIISIGLVMTFGLKQIPLQKYFFFIIIYMTLLLFWYSLHR